jgi:hypothetical protein
VQDAFFHVGLNCIIVRLHNANIPRVAEIQTHELIVLFEHDFVLLEADIDIVVDGDVQLDHADGDVDGVVFE